MDCAIGGVMKRSIQMMGYVLAVSDVLVRVVGIEPTLLAERVFETRASTSFTTPARGYLYRRSGILQAR